MCGVFANVRGALSFAVESQNTVTVTAVALGVPELEAEMSTETDGHLFMVLSAHTDGENCDVSRDGASCTEGGTRTQRDEHEVS